MSSKQYSVRYLPVFYEDLRRAVNHIAYTLNNPNAADALLNKTEDAILRTLSNPTFAPAYQGTTQTKHYKIRIGNYFAFYVVYDNIVEMRRFLYRKRDLTSLL